jgi:putative transposase
MSSIPKNVLREIIKENDFKNPGEIYSYFKDAFKDLLQEMLEAEMDVTMGYDKNDVKNKQTDNYRNGHSEKTVKSQYGAIDLKIPRDRNGEHEPKIIPKYKRDISGIEEKVMALYARGMSTRDIHEQIKDLYGIEISAEMVSKITERVIPEIKEWQNRPLEPIYPFMFLDAIHYKIREDGHILNRAAYVVLGVRVDGIRIYWESGLEKMNPQSFGWEY